MKGRKGELEIRTINGKPFFICNYTYHMIEHRVVIPEYETKLSFANIPCAVNYIREHSETPEYHIEALKTHYDQPNDLPAAPPIGQLYTFGGKLDYETWIGDLSMWDDHARECGQSIGDHMSKKRKRKRTKKVATTKRLSFSSGMYMLSYKGIIPVGISDPVKAIRDIRAFQKRHPLSFFSCEDAATHFLKGIRNVEAKYRNHIASEISGDEYFGPALLIVTKKFSVTMNTKQ